MALHRIFHKDKAAVHVVLADDASFNPIALMHLFHGFSPEYDFSTTVQTLKPIDLVITVPVLQRPRALTMPGLV